MKEPAGNDPPVRLPSPLATEPPRSVARRCVAETGEVEMHETQHLLRGLHGGDGDAERRFVERYGIELLRRARCHPLMRRLRHRTTPEDVVAEVWLRVWKAGRLDGFSSRGPGSLGRYLGVILDRVLKDHLRHGRTAKRACEPVELPDGDALADTDPSVSTVYSAADLRRIVRERLDERERRVFEGKLAEKSSREIGASLDIPSSTVRGIVARIQDKLRQVFG